MAYEDFKDLKRRTASDKSFNIAKNSKYDGYQRELASMVYTFFDKSSTGGGVNIPLRLNEQLAKEFCKPIIRKFYKRKVNSWFKDNIWCSDLDDMQLISKFDKGFSFLLCIIDIFSKHVWVVPLKDKKSASIVNAFQKIFDKSGRKPNKIWVVAQRFLRTLKNKIDIYMTSVSKNVDIDKLDDIVNEYDNTYHRTIKMKPVDV